MKRKLMLEIDCDDENCGDCKNHNYESVMGKHAFCGLFGYLEKYRVRHESCIESEVSPVVQIIAPDNVEIQVEGGKK